MTKPAIGSAHNAVANAAREWAGAWYEENAKDNLLYHAVLNKLFSGLDDFVARCWPHFIPLARATLATALNDKNIPDKTKEEIYDALLLDKTIPRPGNFIDPLLASGPRMMH